VSHESPLAGVEASGQEPAVRGTDREEAGSNVAGEGSRREVGGGSRSEVVRPI
jgi:hypothetical protein